MPTSLDVAFAFGFSILLAVADFLYLGMRFRAQIAAAMPKARRNAYQYVIVGEWGATAIALWLWVHARRSWTTLGLVPPQDWQLVASMLITALAVAFTARQFRAIKRLSDKQRTALVGRLGDLGSFLPHTPVEHSWFFLVSLTAGCCEELLYRGFLTWLVAWYVGLPAAIGVVALAFALGHGYQGQGGAIKAGLIGLAMSVLVVLTGWLVPAMIAHALLDIGSGFLGSALYYRRPATI